MDKDIYMIGKPNRKRNIVQTNKWIEVDISSQFHIIKTLHKNNKDILDERFVLIEQQIANKIIGYKQQDIKKGIFCDASFVIPNDVYSNMVNCDFLCYYCKKEIQILYPTSREPRQWTLERLDNKYGHNRDNIVISCLRCNLCRKTMYHERFAFTKQLQLVKLE